QTLEHVLPERPAEAWGVSEETAAALYKRLGNMVLLKLSVNTRIGNVSFEEKKKAYKASSHLLLTKQVLKCSTWGEQEIKNRQEKLAELAIKTWPLAVR